jgi:aldehyde:ferredoxin oxidoreductase
MDATPGHHTQEEFGPPSFPYHLINSTGFCLFADLVAPDQMKYLTGFMGTITGWDRSREELLKCGERIANIRHCFNLREGINELHWKMPDRIVGRPPHTEGPLAGVMADIDAQNYWCLGALDWDRVTTKPSKKKLLELGLNEIAEELWPAGTKVFVH